MCVSCKSERRAAREDVAAYHEEPLTVLVARVGEAIDSFRAGELEATEVDHVLFQYSRVVKEPWKFCNLGRLSSQRTSSVGSTRPTGGNAARTGGADHLSQGRAHLPGGPTQEIAAGHEAGGS